MNLGLPRGTLGVSGSMSRGRRSFWEGLWRGFWLSGALQGVFGVNMGAPGWTLDWGLFHCRRWGGIVVLDQQVAGDGRSPRAMALRPRRTPFMYFAHFVVLHPKRI